MACCSLQRLLFRSSVARVVHFGLHHHAAADAARLLGGLVAAGADDAEPEVVHAQAICLVGVVAPESASVGPDQPRSEVCEESDDVFMSVLRRQGDGSQSALREVALARDHASRQAAFSTMALAQLPIVTP